MLISEVAERSGVPATTLRFYESVGLLPVPRAPSGYRDYGTDALDRLTVITSAKRLGLPLDDIAALLDVWTAGSCARTKHELGPMLAARRSAAQVEVAALIGRVAALDAAVQHLEAMPDSAQACDADCVLPASGADAPIACSLGSSEVVARVDRWHDILRGATRSPLPGGVRLGVPAARAPRLAELAVAERECCPFFDLRLEVGVPTSYLEVRAPIAAAALVDEVFGPATLVRE